MLNKIKISNVLLALGVLLLVVGFMLYSMLNTVPEGQVGVLAQKEGFTLLDPGAHFNKPFTKITLVTTAQQVSVVEGIPNGSMQNNFSVIWQVKDVRAFWQATRGDRAYVNTLFRAALTAAKTPSNINQNAALVAAGVQVNQVLLTGQVLSDANLQATYQKMQGLADTIAQNIIANGSKNAEAIRAEGDQALIDVEGKANAAAAQVIAAGQAEAMQLNAPLYHKNPNLFKLLVDTKARMAQQ